MGDRTWSVLTLIRSINLTISLHSIDTKHLLKLGEMLAVSLQQERRLHRNFNLIFLVLGQIGARM